MISRNNQKEPRICLKELRRLFLHEITISSIYMPLIACLTNDSANEIKEYMLDHGFDVLGIREADESPVEGYIEESKLMEGVCSDYKNEFHIANLIAESTSIIDALSILSKQKRAFVLVGNAVEGIITRADLQKIPVRMFLFGLITLLEMHFNNLIIEFYPDEGWLDKLNDDRIHKAKDLMEKKKKKNEELGLVDCLQFCDKRDIILANIKIVALLNIKSKKTFKETMEAIQNIRDNLAHAQKDVRAVDNWEEIVMHVNEVERLIQRSEEYFKSKAN